MTWMLKNSDGKKDAMLTIGLGVFLLWMCHGIRHLFQADYPFDFSSGLVLLPGLAPYLVRKHFKTTSKSPTLHQELLDPKEG